MIPRPAQYEFAQSDSLLWVCTAQEDTILPYSFVAVLCEFAQPGSSFLACSARAANSRPYGGVIDKQQFPALFFLLDIFHGIRYNSFCTSKYVFGVPDGSG